MLRGDCFTISPDVTLSALGEESLLYKHNDRRLYRLNETATGLWRFFTAAPIRTLQELQELAVAAGPSAAVLETIDDWRREKLILRHDPGLATLQFMVGPQRVRLTMHPAIADRFAPLLAGFPIWTDTGVAYLDCAVSDDPGGFRLRIGEVERVHAPSDIFPALKAALCDGLLESEFTLALHASTLVRHGRALLLCGAPGAGKTTLSLALAAASFELQGDDICLVAPDGLATGIPFPSAVKRKSWELLAQAFPQLEASPVHRRPDAQEAKYIEVSARGARAWPVSDILFLERTAGVAPHRAPLAQSEAFTRLIAEAEGPDGFLTPGGFQGLSELVKGARASRFIYEDLGQAVDLISRDV